MGVIISVETANGARIIRDPDEIAVIECERGSLCADCATVSQLFESEGDVVLKKDLIENPATGAPKCNHVFCSGCEKGFGKYSNGEPAR